MASMSGDIGSSDNASPPADPSNSAVVATYATFGLVPASDCICPPLPPRPWHNFNNAYDVDGDGEVAPSDALAIINYINATGSGPVPSTATAAAPYLDTIADNQIAPDDVLAVVNQLQYFNLVDKLDRFREMVDRKFPKLGPPLDVTDLQVIPADPNEMPYQTDGISYIDVPFILPSIYQKVNLSQFDGDYRVEAERAVDELLSKVVDDRPPSFFANPASVTWV